jgi:branched-chain amino acid transport system permease protein
VSAETIVAARGRRVTRRRLAGWTFGLGVAVVVVFVPLFATPFTNLQLSLIVAYGVAILGLDVLTGHAGQVSLGQSAFFGLGAYAAAVGFEHGWPAIAGLAVATALACAVGLLAAVPAVRLRGFAFGIITLALPVVAVPLANRLHSLTGGTQGIATDAVRAPAWSGLADDQWRYYVIVVVGAVTFLLVRNLLVGRIGRGLASIRTNETMAAATGVPVQRYKVLAFTVAALCAGVAGWLYLVAVQFISPDSLQLSLAVSLLAGLVVGGVRSRLGALIGAAFYVLVPDVTDKITPGRSYLVDGVVLLVVLLFFRGGVAGALKLGASRVARGFVRTAHPTTHEERLR